MKATNEAYDKLMARPLDGFKEEIEPLSTYKGGEYDHFIADYTKTKAASGRFMHPYVASDTHGHGIYHGLPGLLSDIDPTTVLDLGCGGGEMMSHIRRIKPAAEVYGCTIHVGECVHGRDTHGLSLMPADMRTISKYFNKGSIDLIVAHASLHFLTEEDQRKTVADVLPLLSEGGVLLIIHYKDPAHYTITKPEGYQPICSYPGFIGKAELYKAR